MWLLMLPWTSKPPQVTPEIAFFDPNFTFRSPKSHKNPGMGGWINRFGKGLPKKTYLLFPLENKCLPFFNYFHILKKKQNYHVSKWLNLCRYFQGGAVISFVANQSFIMSNVLHRANLLTQILPPKTSVNRQNLGI